jgi:hypothetical protein
MSKKIANQLLWVIAAGLVVVVMTAGCGSSNTTSLVPNERPQVELSAAPQEPDSSVVPARPDSVFYAVRLQWFSWDIDGRVTHHIYAVDPPALGDTSWVRIERNEITLFFESRTPQNPLPNRGLIASSDFHVFVIKAVDNEGMTSPPIFRAFTSYTVAPQTQIDSPSPSRLQEAITAPTVLIEWSGQDPDGVLTQKPILFKFKLTSQATIQQALGLGGVPPSSSDLQDFFSEDSENNFATWDSVPPDSAFAQLEGLTPGQTWYFAVVAFDEAGAYEPRFLRDNNLLQFKPATTLQAPKITIFNSFFSREQLAPGIDPQRFFQLEVPADVPVEFNWFANPGAPGTQVTGYRWVLDPIDGDIFDETPRENDNDVNRWSSWSISELRTVVGPFAAAAGEEVFRRFYVEARDNVGSISLSTVEVRVVAFDTLTAKPLLVFDDLRGPPDRVAGSTSHQPFGAFPTEAVLDSLMYAVGGNPWQFEPLGRTTSDPGVFAGFDYDTLDYRFFPFEGLPLSKISQYRTLVWLIAAEDAGRRGGKFTTNEPMSALRFANTIGELNTLAVYLAQGGKAWIFGDGIGPAIANGYVSRFQTQFARFPYASTGDGASSTSILWPGNFLYDFMHSRSQMNLNTDGFFTAPKELVDMVPYLPKHRTPGAPWPPLPGATPPRGPEDDPRVGPSSSRNLDPSESAGGWGIPAIAQDLPMLTLTTEWPDWPRRLPPALDDITYVSLPNFILEDHDGNPGTAKVSRLDTLYILRAVREIIATRADEPDGKPVFFYYWGDDHGPIAWTSVNIWMFERTQLQVLAEIILNKLGQFKNPNPKTWTGPTSAHRRYPRLVEVPQ